MDFSEQTLLNKIEAATKRIENLRLNIKELHREIDDQETELIGAKLDLLTLNEKLRLLRAGRLPSDL